MWRPPESRYPGGLSDYLDHLLIMTPITIEAVIKNIYTFIRLCKLNA